MRVRFRAAVALILAGAFIPALAVTDQAYRERRGMDERWGLRLGGFLVDFDTTARVDSVTLGRGTTIDFEEDLSLERSVEDMRFGVFYRFNRKHLIEATYVEFDRKVNTIISRDIQFGDEVFSINTTLLANFENTVGRFAYRYSFISNGKHEAGLSAGLIVLSAEASLESVSQNLTEREDVTAPVPLLGGHYYWTIRPRLFLRASYEYFAVNVDDIDASVSDGRVSIDWYPWKKFGLGVGYNRIAIEVEDESAPSFVFDYAFDGILVYGSAIFGNR